MNKTKQPEESCHYSDLPEGQASVVIPPKFYAMATAVIMIKQNRQGDVKLVYEDGTEEIGQVDYDIVEESRNNSSAFFKIVGDVQEPH